MTRKPPRRIVERGRLDWRGLTWFIRSVLFIWLVSFNQTNQTDQINERDQSVSRFTRLGLWR